MSESSFPQSDDRIPGSSDPVAVARKHSRINEQICRVEVKIGNRYEFGTGILVGSGVVLTCYHVLKTVIEGNVSAQSVVFRFDYHMQEHRPVANTGVEYILRDSDWLIDYAADSPADLPNHEELPAHEELDYVLIRIIDQAGFPPLRGYTPLPDAEIPLTKKAKITIIQHPGGSTILEAKGRFHGFNDNITRLKHTVPTRSGSSGAPCFDDQFNLIAIHQRKKVAIPAYKITQRLKRNGKYQLVSQPSQHSLPSDPISALVYGHSNPMVRKFLEDYNNAPFGGRNKQLEHLNTWLLNPSDQPYLALIEGAGRGKSALLAKWVIQLARNPDHAYDIVYFPISARYNTNLENTIFSALNFRLTRLSDTENVEGASLKISDARVLRDACNELLRHPPAEGRKWLVVLDGLDELAGDLQTFFGLFPASIPPHLRVVVAARSSADTSFKDWLNYLGWSKHQVAQPDLPLLEKGAVLQILQEEGEPLSFLAQRLGMVDRIFELCEGDPLVLRLYIDELISKGEKLLKFSVSDLDGIEPGLDGFFKKWLRDQETIWQEGENPLEREDVWALIRLCALAKGGLNNTDLFALAPEHFNTAQKLHKAIGYLRRFLDGDGIKDGYVFTHPLLADYFEKQHMLEAERQAWMQRFLMYGERTIEQLRNDSLQPEQASAYIVRHYGRLLTNQVPVDENKLAALLCHEWLKAWEKLEGTPGGFLDDISRLYPFAQKGGGKKFGKTIHLALCHASVAGLSANIPGTLLAQAVAKGAIPLSQGLAYARLKPSANERIEALLEIYRAGPDSTTIRLLYEIMNEIESVSNEDCARTLSALAPHLPPDLLTGALQVAGELSDPFYCSFALAGLAPHLPPDLLPAALQAASKIIDSYHCARTIAELAPHLPFDLLPVAFQAANGISDPYDRASTITELAPHLPPDLLPVAFQSALQAAGEISEPYTRASTLAKLAPHLPPNLLPAALQAAIQAASEIPYPNTRAETLANLAPHLPPDLRPAALQLALQTIFDISDPNIRAETLATLAPHLSPDLLLVSLPGVLQSVLQVAKEVSKSNFSASGLADLAPHLPPDLLSTTLQAAIDISDPHKRDLVLDALVPHLPPDLINVALQAASHISDPYRRARTLAALAQNLPPDLIHALHTTVRVVLQIAGDIYKPSDHDTNALAELAPHLPSALIPVALKATLIPIGGLRRRSYAAILGILAPYLPPDLLPGALQIASKVYLPEGHILAVLAPHLSPDLLSAALQISDKISDSHGRAYALTMLAVHLPPNLLPVALQIAGKISDSDDRASTIAELAPHLPPDLLPAALHAATEISDPDKRVRALAGLAPYLPSTLFHVALQAAIEIPVPDHRASALVGLAPYLPPDLLQVALQAALKAIINGGSSASTIVELSPHLPPDLLPAALQLALQAAIEIPVPDHRASALVGLAPYLPPDLLQVALQAALKAIINGGSSASTIVELSPHLPPDLLPAALQLALQAASEIPEFFARAEALATLAPYLPPDLLLIAFQSATEIPEPYTRVMALATLAPHLPPDLLAIAFQSATEIPDLDTRTRTLVQMAPYLPPDLLLIAFQSATEIPEPYTRARTLAELAPHQPPNLLPAALQAAIQAASEIPYPNTRALTLATLAPHLPPDLRPAALQLALQAIFDISDPIIRAETLATLAPHLSPDLLPAALQSATEIPKPYARAKALATLAPHLPPDLLPIAFQSATEIPDLDTRAKTLVQMAPYLPPDLLQAALQAASKISVPNDRYIALWDLAPHLPPALFPAALQIAIEIPDPSDRASALTTFVPLLSKIEYHILVGQAIALLDVRLTSALVPRWEEYCQHQKLDEARELHQLLWAHRKLERPEYLKIISAFAPVIHRLGGEQAIRDIVFGIQQTAEWWP